MKSSSFPRGHRAPAVLKNHYKEREAQSDTHTSNTMSTHPDCLKKGRNAIEEAGHNCLNRKKKNPGNSVHLIISRPKRKAFRKFVGVESKWHFE